MKKELMAKLTPVLSEFVDDVLKGFQDLEKIRKDITQRESLLQELITQKETELSDIRINKSSDKKALDEKFTEMQIEKDSSINKIKQYDELISNIDNKRKEIHDELDKTRIDLIRAKDIRSQAEKLKADAEKTRNNYELKMESLKRDSNIIDGKQKDIEAENKKLSLRENAIFKSEALMVEKEKEVMDRELQVKADRSEVDRLIKRYKLEKEVTK